MQNRGGNFVRARNVTAALGWYGDPERWGSTALVNVPVAAENFGAWVFSPQLVRGQTAELVACSWEAFVAVDFGTNFDAVHDSISVAVELTCGVGQSTQIFFWYPQVGDAANPDRFATRLAAGAVTGGVARHLGAPVIGAAIAGRVAVFAESTQPNNRVLTCTATLQVSPRPGFFQGEPQ